MLDEIVSVVPFRERYLVIYKSGRVLEMLPNNSEIYETVEATFRIPNFIIPRTFP